MQRPKLRPHIDRMRETIARTIGIDTDAVSVRAERTFERLRYLFGGDRPSQTARLTMSPGRIHGRRLEFQQLKGGIPRVTPLTLAC